ncbi:MAG: DUF3048 domain-containing protein [Oscillospiraceae bacterium]|nr:DUF3048 domain-containing protein [Oscillospiraceae bacterium]
MLLNLTACGRSNEPSAEPESGNDVQNVVVEEREYNYITGEALKGSDNTQRPVAVMIDNSKYAQPQYGTADADIIYEMVTEGGITRLMAVFDKLDDIDRLGPVRSARDQFIQFMLPLNAIYVHIGASIYANDMLNFYRYQNIDGLYLGVSSFDYDETRARTYAHEHCWFTEADLIRNGIKATGINTTGNLYPALNFADYREAPVTLDNGFDATDISFRFSDYADTTMHYDAATNKYYKSQFGVPHMDEHNNCQLSFDNFLLLNTAVVLYPDGLCTAFDMTQGGEGYYFYGGKYIPVLWQKGEPENPLIITDLDGNPVQINVGKSYIAVIDDAMVETITATGAVQSVEDNGEVQPAE